MRSVILMFGFAVFLNAQSSACAQEFISGDVEVPLIELYTSEGCSSCPPADKWLSSLKSHDELFNGFVPLAFHVDYWDYIGWKDPFASPEYSQRQRQYAHENEERTVYTPGMRKAGQEWRTWRLWGGPTDEHAAKVGSLIIDIAEDGRFTASFSGQSPQLLQLNVAVLGLDLQTNVKRGENQGKTLKHDFVVLGLSRYASAEPAKWSGIIDRPEIQAQSYAVAAWLSKKGRVKPEQAVGGYLADGMWGDSFN